MPINAGKKLWCLLAPKQRKQAILLFFMMLFGMLLETMGVGIIVPVLTLLTKNNLLSEHQMLASFLKIPGDTNYEALVIGAMLFLVLIYVIKSLFLLILAWVQSGFAVNVGADISYRLFATYLWQPYTFHLQRNSSELIRNLTSEINILIGNCVIPLITLVTELLVLAGLVVLLFVIEPLGTFVISTLLLITGWAINSVSSRWSTTWGEQRQFHEGERIKHVQQGLGAFKDMKILGREGDFLSQFLGHNLKSAKAARAYQTVIQIPRLILELIAVSALAGLVWILIYKGQSADAIVPTLGVFVAAVFRLLPSVNRILVSLQALSFSEPVVDNVVLEINALQPIHNNCQGTKKIQFKRVLKVENISFSYPESTIAAVKNISLEINKGEVIGLVGSSGSGKSTLVDILLGLLMPQMGRLVLDDVELDKDNLRTWQSMIGYVPQTIYLTDDSIRRNIAFGIPEDQIDDQALLRAIQAAQLLDFVGTLPEGVNTEVGERGVRLSGGQRQRIGIARALYHDPDVLVLDEATSALDIATEKLVMEAVLAIRNSKTLIIVTHRLVTVEHCDRIYWLDVGGILRSGAATEIIAAHSNVILEMPKIIGKPIDASPKAAT